MKVSLLTWSVCFQMAVKGNARFNLFGSTVVENSIIESQSSVTVDFKWSHVESILETPPLSSTATLVHQPITKILPFFFCFLHVSVYTVSVYITFLFVHIQNIKIASGDMRSPVFEMYRELEFLQVCVLQHPESESK